LGKVFDPTGAAIVGALVDIQNTGTGLKRHGITTFEGDYVMPSLPVGSYMVNVAAPGFKTFSQSGISVEVGQNARVDAHLEMGRGIEKIEVSAAALQVDTASAAMRTEVDHSQVSELPLNTRDVLQLVTLVPGVGNVTVGNGGAATNSLPTTVTNQRFAPELNVNGTRGNGSSVTLDGTQFVTSLYNRGVNLPNPDSIGEFQLLTNSYGAEYGRASGGVFVAVSKSGTNKFHGAAWDYLRNDALDERNFFAPPPQRKPILKQNQFGGAFGGPIIKDKTFFYFTYEGLQIHQVALQTFGSLTAAERTGDFSAISTPLTDPSTGQPFPNNQIPSSQFDPMAVNWISTYLPVASPATGLVSGQYPTPVTGPQFTVKVDHRFRDSDLASFRFLRTKATNGDQGDALGDLGTIISAYSNTVESISVRDTHIFSPKLIGEFGFSNTTVETFSPAQIGAKTPQQLGGSYAQDGKSPETPDLIVSGEFNSFPVLPWIERSTMRQFDAKLTWISGRHNWKFGILGLHQSQYLFVQDVTSGDFTFSGQFTGNALADLLIGRPVSFLQFSTLASTERSMGYGIFAEDSVKITSRLTLNLGLRYELMTPWVEDGEKAATVVMNSSYHSTRFPTAAPGYAFPGDPGIPAGLYNMDKLDFAPRIGFAYDIFGDGKTAIRGGYGIFYNPQGSILLENAALGACRR
jgi:hypothetical protein